MRRSDGLSRITNRGRQNLRWRTRLGNWVSVGRRCTGLSISTSQPALSKHSKPKAMGRRAGSWVLPREAEEVIERAIREVYLKPTRPTLSHLVSNIHERCSKEGIGPPDRRTVRARIKAIDIRVQGKRRGEEDGVKGTDAAPGGSSVSRPLKWSRSITPRSISSLSTSGALSDAEPPLVDPGHRPVLEGCDRISCVDECALARVGGPMPC